LSDSSLSSGKREGKKCPDNPLNPVKLLEDFGNNILKFTKEFQSLLIEVLRIRSVK